MTKVTLRCWEKSHLVEVDLRSSQIKKFLGQCFKLKKVCPNCKPKNIGITPIYNENDNFLDVKAFTCSDGHLTLISLFGRSVDRAQIKWGEESFENISLNGQKIDKLIDDKHISCNHVDCGKTLKPLDSKVLVPPEIANFKTKTRLGDLWDKEGVHEPRTGHYDSDGVYHPTGFEKANRERLRNMNRDRNVDRQRLEDRGITPK